MTAKNAQSGEFCIEDKVTEYQARALYDNINLAAGEEFVYTKDFFAEKDVENTSMKFYVGGASAGVTSNEITVTEWEISELVGDKSEDKALYRFIPYSKASEWDCFNGRESDIGSANCPPWITATRSSSTRSRWKRTHSIRSASRSKPIKRERHGLF